MSTVIVIPAREGSTRFPNKPMALVHGKKLLHRTWLIAKAVQRVHNVLIATDSEKIKKEAESWGAQVVMTREDCQNGTERTFEAVRGLPQTPEMVINLQGDAVLTPPWVIQSIVDEMKTRTEIQIATPATNLSWRHYDEFLQSKQAGRASGTLVVFDLKFNALYFSKGTIPYVRERGKAATSPAYRHIGLYGYRYSALERYVRLQPTPLEQIEKLEQLRALENGIPIQVILVDYRGRTHWSIVNPEDIGIAEKIIQQEGELI